VVSFTECAELSNLFRDLNMPHNKYELTSCRLPLNIQSAKIIVASLRLKPGLVSKCPAAVHEREIF
jgi:hypothetical protein